MRKMAGWYNSLNHFFACENTPFHQLYHPKDPATLRPTLWADCIAMLGVLADHSCIKWRMKTRMKWWRPGKTWQIIEMMKPGYTPISFASNYLPAWLYRPSTGFSGPSSLRANAWILPIRAWPEATGPIGFTIIKITGIDGYSSRKNCMQPRPLCR